ncbi:MAG: EAL domain-containing protein [Marinobacter sp.]|nr:EAL domain-containing protein [Marinobacter sp.]
MSSVISLKTRTTFWTPARDGNDFLARYQFRSVYQPIYSPTHRRLVGYEALTRVQREGRHIPPQQLFALAHQENLTDQLDCHLMLQHLAAFAGQEQPVWLFLNISPDTCSHPGGCLESLAAQCRALSLQPGQVVLEVVETATDDKQALLDFIRQAKAQGFQIAIDDFGTGDSNFERMWQLEPLIVKLDRSLLVNAEQNPRARLLLESLVKMIRESGSLVLLEGIETEPQAKIALATEADLMQGFLFGEPDGLSPDSADQLQQHFRDELDRNRISTMVDIQAHEGFLRLLRFEILEACHQVMRRTNLQAACDNLLGLDGIKRCFLLDRNGVQQGNPALIRPALSSTPFNPLYGSRGACWAHREYTRNAVDQPQQIHASRPYVALPDAARTVTLSTGIQFDNQTMIFCVDLHPDEVFEGQLDFPKTI